MGCDCAVYEICPDCAPSPEAYQRAVAQRREALTAIDDVSPCYTLAELTTLAQRFLQQSPLTDKLAPELILSSYLVWLAKREQGEGGE